MLDPLSTLPKCHYSYAGLLLDDLFLMTEETSCAEKLLRCSCTAIGWGRMAFSADELRSFVLIHGRPVNKVNFNIPDPVTGIASPISSIFFKPIRFLGRLVEHILLGARRIDEIHKGMNPTILVKTKF